MGLRCTFYQIIYMAWNYMIIYLGKMSTNVFGCQIKIKTSKNKETSKSCIQVFWADWKIVLLRSWDPWYYRTAFIIIISLYL